MGQQFLTIRSTKIKVGQYTNDIQDENSIVLNASNNIVNTITPNSTYISPIRCENTQQTTFLGYNRETKEVIDTCIETDILNGASSCAVSDIIEFTNASKIKDMQHELSNFKNKIYTLEKENCKGDLNKRIDRIDSKIFDYSPEINSIKNIILNNEININNNINDIRNIENNNTEKINSLENRFFKQITILPSVKNDILINTSKIVNLEKKYVNHTPDICSIKTEISKINNSISNIENIQNLYKQTDINLLKIMDRTSNLENAIPRVHKLEKITEKIPDLLHRTNVIENTIPKISSLETITTDTNKDILKIVERTDTLEKSIPRITLLENNYKNLDDSLQYSKNRINTLENANYFEKYFKNRSCDKLIPFKDCDIIIGSSVGPSLKILHAPHNSQGKILSINKDISDLAWVDTIEMKKITSDSFYGDGSNLNNLDMNNVNTGILSVCNGGTGISRYNQGDLIYASNNNKFSRLPVLKNGFLTCTGTSIKWSKNIEENNSNIHINSLLITNDIEVNGNVKQKSKPIFSVSTLKKIAFQRKTIEWDTINLNITNSFINNTFIAPVSGYYSFSLRMITNGCTLLNVELRKNNESIEKCNYYVHESSTEIPLSNSTILQLCKNDEITVYIIKGQMANYKNEFCGYLIEPL